MGQSEEKGFGRGFKGDTIRLGRTASGQWPLWLAYALALTVTVATLLARLALTFAIGDRPALILFMLPIIFSAYVGGLGPGLVSTVVAAAGVNYLLLPPADGFSIARPVDFAQWLILIVSGVLISVLNEALHRSRRRAEASQRLHAVTLTSIGDAVLTTDVQGRVTFLNSEAERLTGWPTQEAVGQPLTSVFRIVHEETREPVEDPAAKVLHCGTVVGLANHTILLARDGRETPIADSGAPIKQVDGAMQGVVLVFRDCSEQKQTERSLRESEHRFRQLIDSLPQLVWTCEPDGMCDFLSPQWVEYTGIPAAQQLSVGWWKQIHRDDLPNVTQAWNTSVATGSDFRAEFRLRRHDGVYRWFDTRAAPLRDVSGRLVKWFGSNTDTTERKEAEEVLRNTERRFRALIEHSSDSIAVIDKDNNILYLSPAVLAVEGYSPEELVERNGLENTHPDDLPLVQEIVQRLVAHPGEPFPVLWRRRHKNGQWLWLEGVATNLLHDPAVQGIVTNYREVTERKRAEEELRTSRSQLQAALDAGGMGIWLFDIRKHYLWLDNIALKFCGLTREQMAEGDLATFLSIIHPEDRMRTEAALANLMQEGSGPGSEFRVLRSDGAAQWIAVKGRLERDAVDRPLRMTGIFMDITARKREEDSQLRAQKLEALGTLAGGIAHDFNNVLLAITGNTRLAVADLPSEHPAQESLAEIGKASARAAELVRRILAFSRPQEQKREISQLQPVVEEALKLVRATLPAMIEIRAEFAPDVPVVAVDSTQVHQIIVNLATNAAHAIGPRSGLITFRLDAANVSAELASTASGLREGRYARLSVSDNGCGMDRATLARIFDPFFTTKPSGQGTGLGLSVVHGIMKNHEGAITVYSEPDKGTTFRLYFPAVTGAVGVSAAEQREVSRGQGERVLYIDDEESLVFLATRMLERLGYEVTGYTDAERALQEFRLRPWDFDVVVTDLSMPGMSGFELAREAFAVRPDMPVLMTSGYVRPEDQEAARRMGVRALILKPNTVDELVDAFDRLFRDVRGRGEATSTPS